APRTELTHAIRSFYGLDERSISEASLEGFNPPPRFGSVRARRKIGEGVLFDAFDHQLDRKVTLAALKSGSDSERKHQRLVQAAARRPWKSVCAVHDWFEFEGHTWAVYERVEGESLAHILRTRGARSLTQATDLVAQLAEGVDVLNQAGGRCGLVSPENVVVGPGYVLLTPLAEPPREYTAPEIELGDAGTHLSDVFALGTLLWECVTGENPHVSAAVKANLRHEWAVPSIDDASLPIALAEVLVQCLAKEPEDRYQSAILLSNALRSYRWNSVAPMAATEVIESTKDRDELLDVISVQASFQPRQSWWHRLFGRKAA
ncbi:MAG TPA: protein kinase, partial [Fimbriimonadaceae bacterium]|nr:protein kinase [Fimbriimonadaceae bacterium]